MIPASFYQPIYLLIVLLITICTINRYKNRFLSLDSIAYSKSAYGRLLAIFLIIFIGARPVDRIYFVDMADTAESYELIHDGIWMPLDGFNYLYDPLYISFAISGIPVAMFFIFIAAVYFGGIYIASKKMFPQDTLLFFLAYLGAFSTFSYATNGIKAGAAASLFLVAVAYKDKLKICVTFLFLTLGFHHSMAAPIAAFIAAYFFKNRKWYLYFWILCLVMAALHITWFMNFFSGYTNEHGAGYLQGGTDEAVANVSGFRPDFILYSAIPIFLGNYLVKKYQIKSEYYDFVWNVYTLTNSVFLLCTYGTFINRIAYLSWLLYPIVLFYPFFNVVWNKCQKNYLKYAIWGHLGFTLFMFFIYYS